jgi:hypothetical protein
MEIFTEGQVPVPLLSTLWYRFHRGLILAAFWCIWVSSSQGIQAIGGQVDQSPPGPLLCFPHMQCLGST